MISVKFLESEKKMIIAKRNSSGSTGDFKLPPAGSYLARLYRIIDIGTQTTEWMGKRKCNAKLFVCLNCMVKITMETH
jgi:hypothetical protein